jgi:hypothetical protein
VDRFKDRFKTLKETKEKESVQDLEETTPRKFIKMQAEMRELIQAGDEWKELTIYMKKHARAFHQSEELEIQSELVKIVCGN